MKKTIVITIAIIACLVWLITLSINDAPDEAEHLASLDIDTPTEVATISYISDTLMDVLSNALTRREGISRPCDSYLIPLTVGREAIISRWDIERRRETITRYMFGSVPYNANQPMIMSDLNLFFHALSSLYAPYIYLGGDEVFLPILHNIRYILSQSMYWTPCELEEIIYTNLAPVITDIHFRLGDRRFYGDMEIFHYDMRFTRSTSGFICIYSELYVRELILQCFPDMSLDIQDVLRFSMDEYGRQFFYAPVIALPAPANEFPTYYLQIIYEDETYRIVPMNMLGSVRSLDRVRRAWDPNPTFEIMQGVPVVAVGGMGCTSAPLDEGGRGAGQFMALTEQLRDEPVFILDLRGNRGGNLMLPSRWFRRLMRQDIPPNFNHLAINNYERYVAGLEGRFRPGWPDPVFFDERHITYAWPACGVVSNEQLIIVLIDRFTTSSAEHMVDLAFSIENVLVVGQNTAGAAITSGGWLNTYLPWSGLRFDFSIDMRIFPDDHFQEGIGFAPDIWVMGDALTAALNMLDNHITIDCRGDS